MLFPICFSPGNLKLMQTIMYLTHCGAFMDEDAILTYRCASGGIDGFLLFSLVEAESRERHGLPVLPNHAELLQDIVQLGPTAVQARAYITEHALQCVPCAEVVRYVSAVAGVLDVLFTDALRLRAIVPDGMYGRIRARMSE